jgi:two-component system, LuxR family, response regulator FixJ
MMHAICKRRAEIVVVDDDPAVLGALKFALEAEGFGVAPYSSGSEMLAQQRFPQSGCMIIDFKLPDMDGLSLLASLRGRGVELPAILITSQPSPHLRKRAAAADMPIIEKPLLGDALLDAIRGALTNAPTAAAAI